MAATWGRHFRSNVVRGPTRTRARGLAAQADRGPGRGGVGARLRPVSPSPLVAASDPRRERPGRVGGQAGALDRRPGNRGRARGARRLPLPERGSERALPLGAGGAGHALRANPQGREDRGPDAARRRRNRGVARDPPVAPRALAARIAVYATSDRKDAERGAAGPRTRASR